MLFRSALAQIKKGLPGSVSKVSANTSSVEALWINNGAKPTAAQPSHASVRRLPTFIAAYAGKGRATKTAKNDVVTASPTATPETTSHVHATRPLFGAANTIPVAPSQVAVGIPADLLRRRPDVRRAELDAWTQSARIGVAKADLYPSIALFGTIGLAAGDSSATARSGSNDLIDGDALFFQGGPALRWNVFNYGRIKNSVRVQDARLQQLIVNYQETVLRAAQEAEDAMVAFLNFQRQAAALGLSVAAAKRSVDLALIQ